MMFPKDRTVYANLNTSFTDFDELLFDLRGKHTTGYVLVSFRAYDGVLFIEDGEVTAGLEQDGEAKASGDLAVSNIASRASAKGGTINVYALAPELLHLLVRVIDTEVIYRDLTSSFTSLDKLITKLREDNLSGYIEITLNDARGGGMVFLESGAIAECVFAVDGQQATGAHALPAIVQSAAAGASFNVYRVADPSVGQPLAAAADTNAPSVGTSPEPLNILTVWSEIIGAIESVVDGLSRPGRFLTTFKEVLVARAGAYPFLDPFAAEFEYRAGVISFEGRIPADFSKGVGDCLSDAMARLAFQLKRADLETRIRERLADFGERHKSVIEKFELSDDIQEFVA